MGAFYLVDEVEHSFRNLSARVGGKLRLQDAKCEPRVFNRSIGYRNEAVRRLVDVRCPFARVIYRAVPKSPQQRLKSMIYVPRNSRHESLFSSENMIGFIKEYYREDLALYEYVREARIKKRAAG